MDYDDIPYESIPIGETHPAHLGVIGRLFGLDTPDPERCRVLELGCAGGGNLIPMAWYLPQGEYLGIELSAVQVADGQRLVERLGLKNVRIEQGDILTVGERLGEFDYIIAHGVYSWVPPAVQEALLALIGNHLAPHGVAYVSYNTLPGWKMRGTLRDMLLHHVRKETTPGGRLAKAYEWLDQLDGALNGLDAFHARYLKQEIAHLRQSHPSYLYHEYLETFNEPLLFTEFMARAGRHGLQYLGDGQLHTMFPTSLGEPAAALLEQHEEMVEQEQYMDFIGNRTFRKTLLCHGDAPVSHDLSLDALAGFAWGSALAPPKKVDLRRSKAQLFVTPAGESVPVAHPLTRAALQHLAANAPDTVAFEHLYDEAARQVEKAGAAPLARQQEALLEELFSLFANQAVSMHRTPRRLRHAAGERPRLNDLARCQAGAGLGHAATPRHTTIALDAFSTRLVALLDGTRTREMLVEQLVEEALAGRLDLGEGGAKRMDRERLRRQVAANCERLLDLFTAQGVLTE